MLEGLFAKGCVYAGRFTGIDHEKYFIIVGVSKDKTSFCSAFINSNIPRYVLSNSTLLCLQVNIQSRKYDFLTHDSFVSCTSINKHAMPDLLKCRYIGKIDDSDLENILTTIINSDVLTDKEKDLYFFD